MSKGDTVISALERFAERAAEADATRELREACERDAAAALARQAKAQEIKAAEDHSRPYSPLVKKIRDMHAALLMTDGYCLDVYVTTDPQEPIKLFQADAQSRGAAQGGQYLMSLSLFEPFSAQWPKELDSLNAEMIVEIMKDRGMLAEGSRLMRHLRQAAPITMHISETTRTPEGVGDPRVIGYEPP